MAMMEPESQPQPMQTATHGQFSLAATALDRSHVAAARLLVVNVGHRQAASSCSARSISAWMCGRMMRATSRNAGTATELPNCL
jgi:hypothetical protein